jgi:hypothetical protein
MRVEGTMLMHKPESMEEEGQRVTDARNLGLALDDGAAPRGRQASLVRRHVVQQETRPHSPSDRVLYQTWLPNQETGERGGP